MEILITVFADRILLKMAGESFSLTAEEARKAARELSEAASRAERAELSRTL